MFVENYNTGITEDEIRKLVYKSLDDFKSIKRVLLIHPDYTREDFTHILVPLIIQKLKENNIKELHFLNASGTHRKMTEHEIFKKLGINKAEDFMQFHNHDYDKDEVLANIGDISSSFLKNKTDGLISNAIPVTVNKLIFNNFDLIIALSSTGPHESAGFSGGLKIFFPGISGTDVIGIFHFAAALVGIPRVMGTDKNYARDIIDEGASLIFKKIKSPVVSFNMVLKERNHDILPIGLYFGEGFKGFLNAYGRAMQASKKIHFIYLNKPIKKAVQIIPEYFDEFWTAGKGSYRLQKPGVIENNGEIIIVAPNVKCFHSNKKIDKTIRRTGYHCRDYMIDNFIKESDYDKNIISHIINVRGAGLYDKSNKKEKFDFKVSLASKIPESVCRKVGIKYYDPKSLKKEDFLNEDCLWIDNGCKYVYELTKKV